MKIAVRPVRVVARLQAARQRLASRCITAMRWIGDVTQRWWGRALDILIALGFCALILGFTWNHVPSFALGEVAALVLWLLIIHRRGQRTHNDDDGGWSDGGDDGDDTPAPDDPSPTAAAVDAWLREQQRLAMQNEDSNVT